MARPRRPIGITLAAWFAMIGVDLALHAGILAPLYDWESPFLLDPTEAFVRIPAGWAAFGVLAAGLAWMLPRLGVRGTWHGARLAAAIGAVAWGALLLATWSIATADPTLLVGWWIGQTASLAIGGAVVGAGLGGASLRRLFSIAVGIVVAGAVVAVVLQSIGYAPAPIVVD